MSTTQRVKGVGVFGAGLVVGGGLVAALAAAPGPAASPVSEAPVMCAVGADGYFVTNSGGEMIVWRYFADSLIRVSSHEIADGEPEDK